MTTVAIASRVGRKPIEVPKGVDIKINDANIVIKGPKGQSSLQLHPLIKVVHDGGVITLQKNTGGKYSKAGIETKLKYSIAGTIRSKLDSLLTGVTKGFERKLVLVGVGYRATAKGKILNLVVGYSHPVNFDVPEGITIETPSQTEVIIKGIDKHLVGQTAAKIRAIRAPEPYKGKGIRYAEERIILKETKKK